MSRPPRPAGRPDPPHRPRSGGVLVALAAIAALAMSAVLTACGSTQPTRAEESAGDPGAAGAASRPITVTDATGTKVTLPGPARDVVALEWSSVEDVISSGVQPVGVADVAGYRSWATAAELTGDPTDVGLRTEPSIDSIAGLNPDLILGIEESIPENALADMREIAPVVLLRGADATRPIQHMRENFRTTARLLGSTGRADRVLADFDAHLADLRRTVRTSGADRHPFIFDYISVIGGTVDHRMHGPRSLPGAVAEEIGLTNAWDRPGDPAYGIGSLDTEGLTAMPADVRILYWGNEGEGDPVRQTLSNDAVWTSLPAVEQNHVYRAGDGIWMYGGPASMTAWSTQLVTTLTR